jgi:D-alanyl-D-alanine endopeptidase (penicillin-binding protein 7)
VRLIRPVLAVRLLATLLGLSLCVAAPASAAVQKKPTTKASASKTQKKKTAYSASSSKARKSRLARARASARAREAARLKALAQLREAMTPRFKEDPTSGELIPDIRAAAAIVFDPETGKILYEENAKDQRSIASITKVMTALVFLEDNPDLSTEITIERSDVYAASTTYLKAKDRITYGELLHLMLIASDNAAARAIARTSHGGTASFDERMNETAIELGLDATSFSDPSGLNPNNLSSAWDLSHLISFAASDERIGSLMRTPEYTVTTSRRTIPIHSTNHLLLAGDVQVMGGKTGFISKAGYCLATLLKLPQMDTPLAFVVLGAHSNNGRFWETRHLFDWLNDKAASVLTAKDPSK